MKKLEISTDSQASFSPEVITKIEELSNDLLKVGSRETSIYMWKWRKCANALHIANDLH